MAPRASRNLDRALLAAGRALLPARGCAGLSVREVAQVAGVNLGMFHYHFRSREAFLRALLQSMYEDMFSQFAFQDSADGTAKENLRDALRFLGRFVRANRPMLARVMADALCGDAVALDFLRQNMPRHIGVLLALVNAAQEEGDLQPVPASQAVAFCAGSVVMPILFAGAVAESGAHARSRVKGLEAALSSDAAIDERIDFALAAIGAPARRKK